MGRARRGWVIIAIVGIVSMLMYALPTFLGYLPEPSIHDEFAYLLQADTFAHGRLTNPPHPYWQFFETFHVIQQPTYAAKFPPGQGIALALGQKLGHPIIGAWLSVAAGAMAVTWMLLAWMPSRWALLGGLLTAVSPVVYWWSQTYWGGGVAMIGGALVAGGAARIARGPPRASVGFIAGIGAGILANSRPFEGMIICLIVGILVVISGYRRGSLKPMLTRALPAAILVLSLFAPAMLYYNWRVTGDPWKMPYELHREQYMVAPLMFWEKPNVPPKYDYEVFRKFYADQEYAEYLKQNTFKGYLAGVAEKLGHLKDYYLSPWTIIIPLLLALFVVRKSHAARWSLIACSGLLLIHFISTPWMRIQYTAPAIGFFFALVMVGLRHLTTLRWRNLPIGSAAAGVLVITQIIVGVTWPIRWIKYDRPIAADLRPAVLKQAAQSKDKQLIFIRYGPDHSPEIELVFNSADIDSSDIIFARDRGLEEDAKLAAYFHGRSTWSLDIDNVRVIPKD